MHFQPMRGIRCAMAKMKSPIRITEESLESNRRVRYAGVDRLGWAPRRRASFGYFLPSEYYESLVSGCVTAETAWLDVGCGESLFPQNANLARDLSQRAKLLVGVDPSENVQRNPYVHERAMCMLEDYVTDHAFDLITLRMVAEHVTDPDRMIRAMARLLRTGGRVIVFTVNLYTPIAILSMLVPNRFHYAIKRRFWGGEEKDTFPTAYRMNTRRQLRRLFEVRGFTERCSMLVDDLSLFSRMYKLNYIELSVWKAFRRLGVRYPENCILAMYEKKQ